MQLHHLFIYLHRLSIHPTGGTTITRTTWMRWTSLWVCSRTTASAASDSPTSTRSTCPNCSKREHPSSPTRHVHLLHPSIHPSIVYTFSLLCNVGCILPHSRSFLQVSFSVLDTRPLKYMSSVADKHQVKLLCYGSLLVSEAAISDLI